MNDVCEVSVRNIKDLWRATSRESAPVAKNSGRQIQAAKRDYVHSWHFSDKHSYVECFEDEAHSPMLLKELSRLFSKAKRNERDITHDFILRADRLVRSGAIESGLDILFETVGNMLRSNKTNQLDEILRLFDPLKLTIDISLALLTASLPARGNLKNREEFFKQLENALKQRGEYTPDLLIGLNP